MSHHPHEEEDEDVNEEKIIQVILELGNQILGNLGVEEHIDDVGVFFSDAFYIQFFQAAFPDIDFSQLEEATNEQEMAENIQALIDLLGEQILKYDLSHIRGEEIVSGNPEHCINLLQLVQEISMMLEAKGEEEGDQHSQNEAYGEEDDDQDLHSIPQNQDEDEEAQIIQENNRRAKEQSSQRKQPHMSQQKSSANQQKRGRSYSDDRNKPQFEVDNFEDDFEVALEGQDDEDLEDDQELQRQIEQMKKQGEQQKRDNSDDDQQNENEEDEDDDGEGEFDEDDLQMYEQFLANQQQNQQQLDEGEVPPPPEQNEQEEEEEDDDLEDLDPEFIAAAREMGYNNQQIRQLQDQLISQGYGDEEGEEVGEDQESFYTDGEINTRIKLLKHKSYSAPYILFSDCFEEGLYDTESQVLQKACSTTMLQSLELKEQSGDEEDEDQGEEMDEETAQMLYQQQQMIMQQKQKQDERKHQQPSKISEANKSKEISRVSQNPQHQRQSSDSQVNYGKNSNYMQNQNQINQLVDQNEEEDEDEMEIVMAQQLRQLQQQQHSDQNEGEDEYGEEIDEGEQEEEQDDEVVQHQAHQKQHSNQKQQQQMMMQNQNQESDDQEQEGQGTEDDDKLLIELDDLDENERQMLLQYLQQEYEKNPDQFPFPKELLQEYMMQQQRQEQEGESVRDIKSDEMIVEQASQQQNYDENQPHNDDEADEDYHDGQDEGDGEGQGEDEELTEEQQQQLQQLMLMQQQQQQQQDPQHDYGEEDYQGQDSNHLPQQHLAKQSRPRKGKSRPKSAGKKKRAVQAPQYDAENIDPNLLQQMIAVQQQQQQYPPQPALSKRRKSAGKRKPRLTVGAQPHNMQKSMKMLVPTTPGNHFKSFNTQRSHKQALSKKKKKGPKKNSNKILQFQQNQEHQPNQFEMPVLSEDFLNQLNEEQLQALLDHQQQLMMLQQQQQQEQQVPQEQQSIQTRRPRSAKKPTKSSVSKQSKVRSQIYGGSVPSHSYYGGLGVQKKKPVAKPAKKKKKRSKQQLQNEQGIFLNNYFPALEGQNDGSQITDESSAHKDQRYPKFSADNINNPNYGGMQQDQIDEVPPEQEEGESQEHIQRLPNFYPQQDQDEDQFDENQEPDQDQDQDQMYVEDQQQDAEGQQEEQDDENDEVELTEEQLLELLQNAHNLPPEQQVQLQNILKEKMKEGMMNDRAQSYQNIYEILMDNVQKAKDRLAHLGETNTRGDANADTDRRILKQKLEFDALLKQYLMDTKSKETKRQHEQSYLDKQMQRESKLQTIKDRKFEEELMNQQKSLMYKRNAQQVKLCQRVYKLASELEKNKLLAEKKEYKEAQERKKAQKKMMIDAIETYYKDRVQMLKDRIENERFERKIAQQAQTQALSRMKRELAQTKKREVEKYLMLLKQEDQRYDLQSTNMKKLEQEIVKLYRK